MVQRERVCCAKKRVCRERAENESLTLFLSAHLTLPCEEGTERQTERERKRDRERERERYPNVSP